MNNTLYVIIEHLGEILVTVGVLFMVFQGSSKKFLESMKRKDTWRYKVIEKASKMTRKDAIIRGVICIICGMILAIITGILAGIYGVDI